MKEHPHSSEFRHSALLYAGEDSFLEGTVPFIEEGLESEQPVLVMVPGRKIAPLQHALGAAASDVRFADMVEIGANPARIIPAWRRFVSDSAQGGRRVRGIGEPIWAGRSDAELVECQRHESLLNLAFADAAPIDLLCPYDEQALDEAVIEEALRSHPTICDDHGAVRESGDYRGLDPLSEPFRAPLPEPPADAHELGFDATTLGGVRSFTLGYARDAGLSRRRCEDLVIAVNELASNSVRHGGGSGVLRIWRELAGVVAEVSDRGRIDWPLAGREQPGSGQIGGHGLWLVNQLCDLMQMRTFPDGSVVRIHVR